MCPQFKADWKWKDMEKKYGLPRELESRSSLLLAKCGFVQMASFLFPSAAASYRSTTIRVRGLHWKPSHGQYPHAFKHYGLFSFSDILKDKTVLIWDNRPRKKKATLLDRPVSVYFFSEHNAPLRAAGPWSCFSHSSIHIYSYL